MNVFYLDADPRLAARQQCDKHVVKMILESAQLLCGVHHLSSNPSDLPKFLYRLTHRNHPCAVWARSSTGHYQWLAEHGLELCREYSRRYNRRHKTERPVLKWLLHNVPALPERGFSEPPQAMPDAVKVPGDSVAAYRRYYNEVKANEIQCRWAKGRKNPDWFTGNAQP